MSRLHPILNLASGAIPDDAFFVARPSPLGNPYAIGVNGDRETVIGKYAQWLRARIEERDPVVCTALLGIRPGQSLVCHCAPKRCHAEVIAAELESGLQERLRSRQQKTYRYAGIGSRTTPAAVLSLMHRIAARLSELGYTLLSGGATGADSAFASGASKKEIYLPWPGFSGNHSVFDRPGAEAFRVASCLHPTWNHCKEQVQALHARNAHEILGQDLRSPVDFVVCWTPDGCESELQRTRLTGGTGQAIALADRWGIPVINLAHGKDAVHRLAELVKADHDQARGKAKLDDLLAIVPCSDRLD